MKGPVAKKEDIGTVLLQAKCAAKTIRAQRDRLLQFQLQLQPQQQSPGDAPVPARLSTEDLGSGIVGAAYLIEIGAKSLGVCLDIAARNGVPSSLPRALAALQEDKLFDRLLALRLPRRPVTQAHAFARVEAAVYAIYAVMLNLQRCIELLSSVTHPASAATDESDPVAAATEHLAKIGLSDPDAAATEPAQDSSNIGLPAPAPAAAATGESLSQEKTTGSMELDQARACLDRTCTLMSLAVKHVDIAVTAISSCVDPKDVARISDGADILAIA